MSNESRCVEVEAGESSSLELALLIQTCLDFHCSCDLSRRMMMHETRQSNRLLWLRRTDSMDAVG